MGPDERAIREANSSWMEGANAADLVRLSSLMTDDAVFLGPGQAPLGRDGFPAAHSAGHQQGRIHCSSEMEEVVVVGEVAYTRARDAVSVTPFAGGEPMRFAGYRLTVWRKHPDGRWLMARDAHTLSPVEQPKS